MYNEPDPPPVDLIRVPVFLGELFACDLPLHFFNVFILPYLVTVTCPPHMYIRLHSLKNDSEYGILGNTVILAMSNCLKFFLKKTLSF